MIKYVKIWGRHRTGTNYLHWQLKNACGLTVFVLIFGNKHYRYVRPRRWLADNADSGGVVRDCKGRAVKHSIQDLEKAASSKIVNAVIIRNPYSWIDAMARNWNTSITLEYVEQNINEYARAYTEWLDMPNSYWFTLEALTAKPSQIMAEFAEAYGLPEPRRMEKISAKIGKCDETRGLFVTNEKHDTEYLLKRQYMARLDDTVLTLIKQKTNPLFTKIQDKIGAEIAREYYGWTT